MALQCGWELMMTHTNGSQESTCGLTSGRDKCNLCNKKVRIVKAYDLPVPPNSKYMIQAGDRIWAKMKK